MKKLNEIFCSKICLTSPKTLMVLGGLLISTLVKASVLSGASIVEPVEVDVDQPEIEVLTEPVDSSEIWVPTEDDIAYQDSMFNIIQNTQSDVDTIKEQVQMIIERLEYKDGTHDIIRRRK